MIFMTHFLMRLHLLTKLQILEQKYQNPHIHNLDYLLLYLHNLLFHHLFY